MADMNPLAVLRNVVDRDGSLLGKAVWLWCPGCEAAHRVAVGEPWEGSGDVWEWNGHLDERITVSPSILCHSSVHLCPKDYVHEEPCLGYPDCGHVGHALGPNGEKMKRKPCVVEPSWGSCHSFLRDGVWDFLGDSAHALAGQRVPVVPVPDWMIR